MPLQLYDLFQHDKTNRDECQFLMRAPVGVVGRFLSLHPLAMDRIVRQTEVDGGLCELYPKNHDNKFYIVARAVGAIGPEH